MRHERSYRGISVRAAIGYLERLGGEQVDERTVESESWRATVTVDSVNIGPSLSLTETTVEFEGAESVLEPLSDRFSQKAIRGGG
jgi:hypothetical protein